MLLGERIKKERQLRKLTLLDVASDCQISESQLYKIENGKVNLKTPTLLKLATYYGYDVIGSYGKLIEDDVFAILNLINKDIKDRNINNIKTSLEIITYINQKTTNTTVLNVAKQYYYLINGIISLNEKDYLAARESFLNGIKNFNAFIDTRTFNNIGSSNIQLRLLMAYALTFKGEQDYGKCLNLLGKVFCNVNRNDLIYKKATYNLANIYSLIKEYNKSKEILYNYSKLNNMVINIDFENIIYFKHATVSYRLGYDDYIKHAKKCLYSSVFSRDTKNGIIFLNVFNNLFDIPIMTEEHFLSL